MNKSVYLMVIAPHPDDSEFGIAGTVARLTKEGKKVVYVICTNGDKGTSDRKLTPEKLAKIREKEQRAAAELLGVSEVVFLGYPDQGVEDTTEFRSDNLCFLASASSNRSKSPRGSCRVAGFSSI